MITLSAPDFDGQLASVSYAPFDGSANPDEGGKRTRRANPRRPEAPGAADARDPHSIPRPAASSWCRASPPNSACSVTVGAWIDKHQDRNEREIRSAIDLAKRHSNVNGIIVGNETIYRGEQTVPDLIKKIQRVKRSTNVPVTTGEIWNVWIEHPELVSAVDYHRRAHPALLGRLLRQAGRRSGDPDLRQAAPSLSRQAHRHRRVRLAERRLQSARTPIPAASSRRVVLRDFVTRADAYGIDYNIVEAIDQPWKTFEGGVGPYWGLFDASRQPKFAWTGPITNPDHWKLAGIALAGERAAVAADPGDDRGDAAAGGAARRRGQRRRRLVCRRVRLLERTLLRAGRRLRARARHRAADPADRHRAGAHRGNRRDRLRPQAAARSIALAAAGAGRAHAPKVSIHIPAYREPPEMLKQTLDAVARLDYPNFECVVVINNTPDPALWLPIEEHCRALGERFKFVRADNLAGLQGRRAAACAWRTPPPTPRSSACIDADYVVQPDWLKDLVPLFADPAVGLVQAPQDHRDGDAQRACITP